MSTLRTRIAGYPFVIITEADGRKTGAFMAESNGERVTFMDLPYELRSTYSSAAGQTIGILAGAVDAIHTLEDRVDYVQDSHQYAGQRCNCEQCTLAEALYVRQYVADRAPLI